MSSDCRFAGLSLGLVGLGQQSRRRHLPALASLGICPVAVHDPDPDACDEYLRAHAEAFPGQPQPVVAPDIASLAELANTADVVVPPACHAEIIESLLACRTTFIAEKPLGRSWLEAVHFLHESSKTGVRAAYLENWLFDPVTQHVETAVVDGAIGAPQRICVSYPNAGLWLYPRQSPWRGKAEQGGALLDWGSHAVGLAWYLAGLDSALVQAHALDVRASRLRALVSGAYQTLQVEDVARFELIFRRLDGRLLVANIDASWVPGWTWSPGYSRETLRVDGARGSVAVTVTNTADGRRYAMSISRDGQPETTIDLGLLKQFDPTVDCLRNALLSFSLPLGDSPECSLEFAAGVQLALGCVRLSAARCRTVAPDDFTRWCSPFLQQAGEHGKAWDLAMSELQPPGAQ